ncbi:MAG: YdeI/OmpD-associated family protein [Notoacmeibacter sp.]|nr:YdeI/OmpD-associated family protein [Notoacmeibacter sp.]MCC0032087.1 YdeI/OmpD-associated family protein [Brucellaceae bacterium]
MIESVDDFLSRGCGRCGRFNTPDCSTRRWRDGLEALRRICLEAGLSETVKWAHPCYVSDGRNIAVLGAFRDDFRITFFAGSLLKDPAGVLEKPGENTRHANMIRFTDTSQVAGHEATIRAYLDEAALYARQGIKPEKLEAEWEVPEELAEALDSDPQLAEAFHALTPGRQRSYVLNLAAAKKTETRISRIAGFRDRILAGKGANER